jgi:hypothetical protein
VETAGPEFSEEENELLFSFPFKVYKITYGYNIRK